MATAHPTEFSRVMRRYDRAAHIPWRFTSYTGQVKAMPTTIDGKEAATLFFRPGEEVAARRAERLGWIDETEAYRREYYGDRDAAWAALQDEIAQMEWPEFKTWCSERGINGRGKKPEIMAKVLAWFNAQQVAA